MSSGKRSSASGREVELGYVSGVFGVSGEVRLHLHNRDSDLLAAERVVVLVHPDDGRRVDTRLVTRPGAGKRVLGRIDGVSDPEAARAWMGWRIVVPREVLPAPDEGEFYVFEAQGLPVYVDGAQVGEVTQVHSTGAVDVLEVSVGGAARFVPLLRDLVTVDVPAGRVEVVPGALDEP